MPTLSIPKSAYTPVRNLIGLQEDTFSALVSALKSAEAHLSVDRYTDAVVATFPREQHDTIKAIVLELCRMENGRSSLGLSAEEFVNSLIDTARKSPEKEMNLSGDEGGIFLTRATSILGKIKSINIVSKAFPIFVDHAKTFNNAKVLTDIRPIFTDDAKTIQAATLVHTLVIEYNEGREMKKFHIALDVNDISAMKKVLDRAEEKATQIGSFVTGAKIPYLLPEP